MITFLKALPLFCLIGIAPTIVHAGDEDLFCRNGDFPAQSGAFGEARVVGNDRLHFLSDMDGCPGKGATCAERAYVLPGDRLIVGRRHGSYRCVFYPGKGGGSAGWVPEARLKLDPAGAAPALKEWLGSWHDGDNRLHFTAVGAALKVEGDAYWPSADPPPEERPGGPNLGSIEAVAEPSGREAHFAEGSDDDSCHLRAVLLGRFLLVTDNSHCGGMNVRFDGVYRREQAKPDRR